MYNSGMFSIKKGWGKKSKRFYSQKWKQNFTPAASKSNWQTKEIKDRSLIGWNRLETIHKLKRTIGSLSNFV
jgi:hypothetical protein